MQHKLRSFLLVLVFLGACNVQATTFYVDREHPAANDSNPGSEELPWKTLVYAAEVAGAGDTVLVKAGIYTDGDVVVANSGAPGQELVFAAYPGHERQAVIKGAAFLSYGKSHLVVRDLMVLESPSQGFRFEGPANPADPPAENITISGVHTYDTCSSGIAVWGVKWGNDPGDYDNIRDVVIENNLLELGTHGCKNEIITVANGAVNITVRNNEIRLGDPAMKGGDEGIDFKEGVRNSRIYGNYIHDLSDKAIYIDGGSDPHDPQITNIHIYNNVMMRLPSAGIVVTTEGEGDVDGVYVYNNIVAHVDGDGYRVYDHPGGKADGGTVKNVHFINNTAVGTGRDYGGGFRVNHDTATGIVFQNNIAWNNRSYDIRPGVETVTEANLCRESLCETQEAPQFVDEAQDDYRLQAISPAIDTGLLVGSPAFDISGTPRPQGNGVDLGAWEYHLETPEPPRPPPPSPVTVKSPPTADTSVDQGEPNRNYGDTSRLEVDARPEKITYLRFKVSGIKGTVQSARLRLEVRNRSRGSGGTIFVSETNWDEATMTYNKGQPAIIGDALDTLGPVSVGQLVEFDVTAAINGDGTYSFAILSSSKDGADYYSSEGSSETPLLIVDQVLP